MLNKAVVSYIFQTWEIPLVDLFVTAENKQTRVFCSWALAVDALLIEWQSMFAYAFPHLIMKSPESHEGVLLQTYSDCLFFPRQHWFPQLLQLLRACPIKLPDLPSLLTQGKGKY